MNVLDIVKLIGLVVGLNQVIKMAFNLPDKFGPLLELVIGTGLSLGFIGLTRDNALLGLVAGLSAAGLWNGAQSLGTGLKSSGRAPNVAIDDVVPTQLPQGGGYGITV